MFIPRTLTLEDILHTDGVASVLIGFVGLATKRNLRLVCHAGKDAVDSTVTRVCIPGMIGKISSTYTPKDGTSYGSILANSNWKDIKRLEYRTEQCNYNGGYKYMEKQGLSRIAEAGLSKLESLTLRLSRHEETDGHKLVKAGWKLKELDIAFLNIPSEWFGTLVRDANWPLEELTIYECYDSIADLIAVSEWKLKGFCIRNSLLTLSPEAVESLMQGSWVSTIERLTLSSDSDIEEKGARAISQASHRAVNLLELQIITYRFDNEEHLILGEGSYPNLKRLRTKGYMLLSGEAAILRKCPKLEKFHNTIDPYRQTPYDFNDLFPAGDSEDAKFVRECCKNGIRNHW